MLERLRHWQPQRIITMYWAFFAVVFLVPAGILTATWMHNEVQGQRAEVDTARERALTSVRTNLNDNLAHLLTAANQMAIDPAFARDPQNFDDYAAIEAALHRYNLSSPLVQRSWVNMFRRPEALYSADGTYDTQDTLYKYNLLPAGTKGDQQDALIHSSVPHLLATGSRDQDAQLTLVVPLMPLSGEQNGVVFFTLNTESIQDILAAGASSPDQVLGLAVAGRTELLSKPRLQDVDLAGMVGAKPKTERVKAAGQALAVTVSPDKGALFQAVSYALPYRAGHSLLRFLGNSLWLLGLVALLGFGLIHWFAKRQYALIARLESALPSVPDTASAVGPESARLQTAIEGYIADHQNLITTSKVQLPFVRNQILQLLLNGRIQDPDTTGDLLEVADLHLPYKNFVVALLARKAQWNADDLAAPYTAEDYTVLPMHRTSEAQVVLLINYADTQTPAAIVAALREQGDMVDATTVLYLSRAHRGLATLHEAYIEVVSTQITAHPGLGESVTYETGAALAASREDMFDFTTELKLDNSLLHRNFDHAQEAFEVLFNLASQNYDPRARFDLGMSNLITRVLKADYQRNLQVSDELVRQLLAVESLSQLHTLLLKTIRVITAPEPVAQTADQPEDVGAKLRAYIEANAASPTLSLVDVADHFGYSVPYTSRYVKEVTGKTFTNFVAERRLVMIETALVTTSLPIKTIIEQNGYYDVANFTRKFKKLTGITPGEYRRTHAVAAG
ncbi:helix-turn-helix transcriptional regulator [Lacticaseibacillus parakribbianus]|uniref:helix-turn-helix transcriptional regulator n=1 Tax=Lacticaseibacillus parakribbianus TaxID=2970927 RepID=UPI0021CB409D|nr:AraC family transcriptional regulator [Lacticaseibacillus parakribbianus]